MKVGLILIFTVFALVVLFLTSCKNGYKIENDKVFYEYWHEGLGFKKGKMLIENADANSFESLNFDCDCSFVFGKDKNYLFIDGKSIKNIDPNTFRFIGNYIFRDKNSAYFFGFYNDLNNCAIEGVNPDKIQLIKYPWSKADNLLINGKNTVHIDDINGFVPLDNNWGKTDTYIINKNKILYGADIATFKATSSFQGEDKNYKYEFGIMTEESFKKVRHETFGFDEKKVCELEPMIFIDIYKDLVSYKEDKNRKIETVERLKLKNFKINNIRHSNWIGESKMISVSMTNEKCNCIVEKIYRYDYSKPNGTEKIFNVTERIHCQAIK